MRKYGVLQVSKASRRTLGLHAFEIRESEAGLLWPDRVMQARTFGKADYQ